MTIDAGPTNRHPKRGEAPDARPGRAVSITSLGQQRVNAGAVETVSIKPVFSNLYIVHARHQASYAPHQHFDYQIVLVEQGVYRCRLNQSTLRLRAGQVLIVKPGNWHEDACRPPCVSLPERVVRHDSDADTGRHAEHPRARDMLHPSICNLQSKSGWTVLHRNGQGASAFQKTLGFVPTAPKSPTAPRQPIFLDPPLPDSRHHSVTPSPSERVPSKSPGPGAHSSHS